MPGELGGPSHYFSVPIYGIEYDVLLMLRAVASEQR